MSEEDNYDDEELKQIQSFLSGGSQPQQSVISNPPQQQQQNIQQQKNIQQNVQQQPNYPVYNQQNSQQTVVSHPPLNSQQHVNINSQQAHSVPIKTQNYSIPSVSIVNVNPPQQYVKAPPQYTPKLGGATPVTSTVINKPPAGYVYSNTPSQPGTTAVPIVGAPPPNYNPSTSKPPMGAIPNTTINSIPTTAGYPSTPNSSYNPTISKPPPIGTNNTNTGIPIRYNTPNTTISVPQSISQVGIPPSTQYKPTSGTTTTTTTTTTLGQPLPVQPKPPAPNPITSQIQNHFNALALAYRNHILLRPELMEHLEILFGKHHTATYIEKIDSIPPDRVPQLPKDFDIIRIKEQTHRIRELAISNTQKPNTSNNVPSSSVSSASSVSSVSGSNIPQNIRPIITNNNPIPQQQKNINPNNNNNINNNIVPMNTTITTSSNTNTNIYQISNINTNNNSNNLIIKQELKRKKPEDSKEDEKQNLKDLNDVTKIANIDMKNEMDGFFSDSIYEDDENYIAESEPLFLNTTPLRKKLCTIATRNGVKVGEEKYVVEYISLACQDYLRTVLEFLIKTSQQRLELQKEDLPTGVTNDVKKKLQFIEKREREERTRKETEENDKILAEAKRQEQMSKKKVENEKIPTALREKINKVKAEEEEKARTSAANTTALAAVGNLGRKKVVTPMISKTGAQGPPIPNPQLGSMLQLIKEGKSLAPEQIPLFQQLNSYYEKQLKVYNERLASQPPPPPVNPSTSTTVEGQSDGTQLKSFLPPSTLDKSKSMRRITKKDCLFSQAVIKPHILLKHELQLKTKKFNNLNSIPL